MNLNIKETLSALKGNKYIILLGILVFISYLGAQLSSSVNTYYAQYIIGDLSADSILSLSLIPVIILMVFLPIPWPHRVRGRRKRLDKPARPCYDCRKSAKRFCGMKYNGFYFWLFSGTMKRVLTEKYDAQYAAEIMKKSKGLYRSLVENADDIGADNPMAYNELFALAFVAPYIASDRKIPPETVQELMRQSLYHVKWYFAMTNLNTEKGKAANKKSVVEYVRWYTPDREKKYPNSFKVDFVGQPYPSACYYRITRCPICAYCEKLGVQELMPLFCELDNVMITLQHGVLHREQTIASGGEYCDCYIVGDHETETPRS